MITDLISVIIQKSEEKSYWLFVYLNQGDANFWVSLEKYFIPVALSLCKIGILLLIEVDHYVFLDPEWSKDENTVSDAHRGFPQMTAQWWSPGKHSILDYYHLLEVDTNRGQTSAYVQFHMT